MENFHPFYPECKHPLSAYVLIPEGYRIFWKNQSFLENILGMKVDDIPPKLFKVISIHGWEFCPAFDYPQLPDWNGVVRYKDAFLCMIKADKLEQKQSIEAAVQQEMIDNMNDIEIQLRKRVLDIFGLPEDSKEVQINMSDSMQWVCHETGFSKNLEKGAKNDE